MKMNNKDVIKLSTLGKTWIFDIDGTIVKHNGYKIDNKDTLLDGAKEFFKNISKDDMVILITARKVEEKEKTEQFLRDNKIRYDYIIFDAPKGERIVINDEKPDGLKTAIAINTKRDVFMEKVFNIDESLQGGI